LLSSITSKLSDASAGLKYAAKMSFEGLETICVDIAERVATVTLNRPNRLNAYTVQMGAELFRTFAALDQDAAVRAIVVTGKGRGFCAGMDLGGGGDTFSDTNAWEETRRLEAKVRPWNFGTPIIAAINGPAVGIGATLPLHWDIRIAGESAKIGFVFTRRGIIPEANSTWILPRIIGLSKAMDLLITGRVIGAKEALDYGIVSRVVADDELMDAALGMAGDIADNTAPASVAITRQLLWRQLMQTDPRASKAHEDELFNWVGQQADAAEGVVSFLEKRPPVWKMSSADRPDALPEMGEDDPDPG
jgi:enoyl-CoA hydratase/carnithine racemase